jgi:hypothetical protein
MNMTEYEALCTKVVKSYNKIRDLRASIRAAQTELAIMKKTQTFFSEGAKEYTTPIKSPIDKPSALLALIEYRNSVAGGSEEVVKAIHKLAKQIIAEAELD